MLVKCFVFAWCVLISTTCLAVTYTWNGATNAWALNTNWSPIGVPAAGDNVIIVTAAVQPLLDATQSITDFTITSGTLDLNTFTLTVTGIANYSSGVINNGTIISTGTTTTFSGTLFGAAVDATSPSVFLNGSTFNNIVNINKTGALDDLCDGGNRFNAATVITNSGSGYLALSNIAPDIFVANVTFNNTGTDELYVAYNAPGNQFNGTTTFINAATARNIYSNAGIGGTAAYNGNIVISNASAVGGIFFGTLGGTATLAATGTIAVGGSGFSTGTLLLRDFTQNGGTAQSLTLTGTALLQSGPSTIFTGDATFVTPQVLLNGTRFNSTASITKNGATQNNSDGGNIFVGAATLNNTGSGIFLMGNSAIDTFNDLSINNTGTSQIHLATNVAGHLFNGNITVRQTSGTGIFFGSGTGTSELADTKTISAPVAFSVSTLNLARFTQVGATPQSLTFTGTALLQLRLGTVFDGNVTFSSPQVLLSATTFNRTAAITKSGATNNTSIGGNIYNGITTITNSGSGDFELANTNPERFMTDLTVNNTGTGRIQIGISSAGNLFNGNSVFNHGGTAGANNMVLIRNAGATGTFNGNVTFNCANGNAGSGIVIANDGTATFNGNITVVSTNGRGVLFGAAGGSASLANNRTITAGAFTTGTLTLNRFTQTGGTAQNITLTGTANLTLDGPSTFNGAATFVAPQLFLNGSVFNSTASITKNGATGNSSVGGNTFNGVAVINSTGTGLLRLANGSTDDFNADVSFNSTGAGGMEPAYSNITTFAGNVTVNSATPIVFGVNTGTATFDGGTAQTISKTGAANPRFSRLRINKTANNVTLNTEIEVSTLLTFTSRNIISSVSNPVTFTDNATVATVSSSSFVSGPVNKIGDDAFTFPVGKSTFYRPVEMSAPAVATDRFTGEYFLSDPNPTYSVTSKDASINHLSRCEYWILDRTSGTSNVSVTLSWNTTSCGVNNLPELLVAGWDGAVWRDRGNGGTTGTAASGTVASAAVVTTFGPFTLGSTTANNPLPIELLSFKAIVNGNSVDVKWATATEINNDYFVVERTIDGEKFESIDMVKGAGNSYTNLYYSAKDVQPYDGTSYYRLKQVDYDGHYTYSKLEIVHFIWTEHFNFILYPNPTVSKTSLVFKNLPATEKQILIVVNAIDGKTLLSTVVETTGIREETFHLDPVNKLAPGIYIITAQCGSKISRQKLIVN